MKTILVDAVDCFVVEDDNGDFSIFDEMQELLDKYPNRKIILTGANDDQFKLFGLDEIFSLKHDPEKTDPKYYEIMLKHFGLDLEEVIYFEHSKEAVESSKSVGINTMFYDNHKKDLDGLKEFLDSNL